MKADEEIKIQVEWQPHKGDVPAVAPPKKVETIVKKVVEPINKKFLPYLTARIDVKLATTEGGDFKILSISDKQAGVQKPAWLQNDGVGYQIQSYAGSMKLIAQATAAGKIQLRLRGLDVRESNDMTKRIPYWIDYTQLIVNGKTIFDKVTPAWCDKTFNYNLDVRAGEEIEIQTDWLPHSGDVPAVAPIVNKLSKQQRTARLDVKLETSADGDFQIISISDKQADVRKPPFLQKGGVGYQIQSASGSMAIVAKATAAGQLNLDLKGVWVPNPEDKSKRIPQWIDYTSLTVNGEVIFDEIKPAWHDEPYNYTLNVEAGEEIKIETKWEPHMSDTWKFVADSLIEHSRDILDSD